MFCAKTTLPHILKTGLHFIVGNENGERKGFFVSSLICVRVSA